MTLYIDYTGFQSMPLPNFPFSYKFVNENKTILDKKYARNYDEAA